MIADDELSAIEARAAQDMDEDAPTPSEAESLARAVRAQIDRVLLLGEVKRLRAIVAESCEVMQ